MIDSKNFIEKLQNLGIDFFCGVPDSLMSEFSKSLHFDFHDNNHIIASNEGSALSIGMGYNLSTQKIPLIYLQNSGLGNIVNPYVSLLHKEIYNIPFVLLIGWRGEPNKPDEPQHKVQGRITEDLLKLLEIDYIYFDEKSILEEIIGQIETYTTKKKPLAILVKKDSFKNDSRVFENDQSLSTRSGALKKIIGFFGSKAIYLSTTGKLSRELYSLRQIEEEVNNDLYVIGGMGHASSIALGILESEKKKNIVCLDGDGSLLMHMGQLSLIADKKYKNFYHILFNNSSHESVGGQPNLYSKINSDQLFKSFGYETIIGINSIEELDKLKLEKINGPAYIDIKVQNFSSSSLPRPSDEIQKYKDLFIEKLNE